FNDENKGNIKPYTYLPFGAGPRNCIGSRFALLETKALFFYILSKFEIVPVEKTQIPLQLSRKQYSGFYQFFLPTLLLKDPELIKQITVKDFDHFVDHRSFIPEDSDPLWRKNLISLTGQRWREMRATLSPAFTGSKMKYMFPLISQSGERFVDHFLKKNEDIVTVEMKDTFTRFTNDVIANTAFGVECDSLEDRNNEFYLMGKEVTDFSGFWKKLKFVGYFLMPKVYKLFKVKLFSSEVADFFTRLVKSNIDSREKHGIVRPDMINLLMKARKDGLKHEESHPVQDTGFATVKESEIGENPKSAKVEITDTDITSQALIFFFAGFDSVSSLMCFMSYELGVNPDVQERLIREVDATMEACNGKLTHEALLSMKYMDMVVWESLRKWPNSVATDRVCTKPYTIEAKTPDEKPLFLEKNTAVWVPIFALHRDPLYFPDPDKFDPERFSHENRENIKPFTYLPFGVGPRSCIGARFAFLETKALFFYILSKFEIVPVEKTQIPLQLSRKHFNMTAEGGFWFGLKRRIVAVVVLIYYKIIKPAKYWEERDVVHVKSWPLIGSMSDFAFKKKHIIDITVDIYQKFPNERCVGYMAFTKPFLMLRDLELIKQIGVKDFDHFHDHLAFDNVKSDPLISKTLVSLSGEEWRQMRATLSPAFTSSKMRSMYQLMAECAKNFVNHFRGKEQVAVDMKDIFSRFANDVIATAAFGISIDSLDEPNNEFFTMGKHITKFGLVQTIKIFLMQLSPTLANLLRLQVFGGGLNTFFRTIVKDNISKREAEGIVRPDLIHLLMEARKGRLKHENAKDEKGEGFATVEESQIGKNTKQMDLTDDLIAAQALSFFL
ncbi:uncharacterized protein BDFB_009483, partial [Asbolus verrucosus]